MSNGVYENRTVFIYYAAEVAMYYNSDVDNLFRGLPFIIMLLYYSAQDVSPLH